MLKYWRNFWNDLVNELVPSENRISNKSKQFINLKNRHLFSNNRDNVKIYKKFKTELKKKNTIKITDDKSQIEKLNKTKIPYRNINFIFEDSLEKQRFKISFVNYLLPFFYLRKKKKYQLLCKYSDYIDSYLSIEEMLPIIERMSKYFKEKKNNENFNYNYLFNMGSNKNNFNFLLV